VRGIFEESRIGAAITTAADRLAAFGEISSEEIDAAFAAAGAEDMFGEWISNDDSTTQ
jgi:hypothetical protein